MLIGPMLLVAAAVAALGALVASLRAVEGRAPVGAARGALGTSAAFTAAAAATLVWGLLRADLTLAFVAQHLTTNLDSGGRLLALWADAPGSALAVATLVSLSGALFASHPAAIALVSATASALLAASIAGGALSALPWTPLDGLGLPAPLRHPLALPALGAACLSGVTAILAGTTATKPGTRSDPAVSWMTTTFALFLVTAVLQGAAAVLSGAVVMLRGPASIWLAAAVTAAWSALAMHRASLGERAALIAAGAGCGGLLAAALAGLGDTAPGLPVQAIALLSVMCALYAALGPFRRGATRGLDPASIMVLVTLGTIAAVTVAGQQRAVHRATVQSGAVVTLDGLRLAHQGISRYETDQAHVVAVALERQDGPRPGLARAEQREYVDARGATSGDVVSPPAVFHDLWRTRFVWLEGIEPGDAVRLRASTVILGSGWWLAALLGVVAALLAWSRRPPSRAGPARLACPSCGTPAVADGRWCSNCGRRLASGGELQP